MNKDDLRTFARKGIEAEIARLQKMLAEFDDAEPSAESPSAAPIRKRKGRKPMTDEQRTAHSSA
jgi:hypothetical protein